MPEDFQPIASAASPEALKEFFAAVDFQDPIKAVDFLQTIPDDALRLDCLQESLRKLDGREIVAMAKVMGENKFHSGSRDDAIIAGPAGGWRNIPWGRSPWHG